MRWLTAFLAAVVSFSHCAEACLGHLVETPNPHSTTLSSLKRSVANSTRSRTALHNVRVFDGQKISSPQTIFIDGDVIATNLTDVDTTIDAGGRILIPGLIDSHAHPVSIQALANLTSYGVTTAVNMACYNYTACDELRHHGLAGIASYISAGIPVISPGSQHSKTFALPDTFLLKSTDDPTAAVSYSFGNGSDFFKIVAEPNGPSQDMQNALVAAVHKLGKQAMTHAAYTHDWAQAAMSNTDGIQHIASNGPIGADVLATIANKNSRQFNTPTMNIFKEVFRNPALMQLLGRDPRANDSYAIVSQNVRAVHAAGIPILAGTDAIGAISPSISILFGASLHAELEYLVNDGGLTPAEALRAATSLPAKHHQGLEDRGVIAPGMRADLVLLNSDPLVNISYTRDIARVWVAGVEYSESTNNSSGTSDTPIKNWKVVLH
ncbi:hypothetical protein B0T17DRAFT_620161 [Bombardia bombarda]|uniref:Amidohydrolase-related domain-containing protein n=1 Tax=Bombardia bombarda TaxID=252184 RepID=A0AA39WH90_9PEZI|nr:hypothetical protein B0T17DRAFT_620161 [Bombardia bombarda]